MTKIKQEKFVINLYESLIWILIQTSCNIQLKRMSQNSVSLKGAGWRLFLPNSGAGPGLVACLDRQCAQCRVTLPTSATSATWPHCTTVNIAAAVSRQQSVDSSQQLADCTIVNIASAVSSQKTADSPTVSSQPSCQPSTPAVMSQIMSDNKVSAWCPQSTAHTLHHQWGGGDTAALLTTVLRRASWTYWLIYSYT